jgi:hypothetical protein
VFSWLEEHKDALHHLAWPAQLPDLDIIEPLWSVLESRVRSRFPPPSSLKQLKDVLRVYSKKGTNCFTGIWWPNSILIKKHVSFMTVSIILSIPFAFHFVYFNLN